MPANRTFDFSVSTLTRDSRRLYGALIDPVTGPAVTRRLAKKNSVAGQPDIVFAPLIPVPKLLINRRHGALHQRPSRRRL